MKTVFWHFSAALAWKNVVSADNTICLSAGKKAVTANYQYNNNLFIDYFYLVSALR